MTVDTAIEILTDRRTCMECVRGNGSCEDCDHAFDMAIETLEERKEGFWDVYTDCEGKRTYYTCPFCKNKTNHFMYEPKYCDKCGARLKIEGSDSDAID